jgi:hypothetical protein
VDNPWAVLFGLLATPVAGNTQHTQRTEQKRGVINTALSVVERKKRVEDFNPKPNR